MSIHLNSSLDSYLRDSSSRVGSPSATATGPSQVTSSLDPDSCHRFGIDSAIISDPAKLFSQLERLSDEDPATFRKITAQIGTQLRAAANASADSYEASFITGLAGAFENAARSGKFADLLPERERGETAGDAVVAPTAQLKHNAGLEVVARIFSDALSNIRRNSGFFTSLAGN